MKIRASEIRKRMNKGGMAMTPNHMDGHMSHYDHGGMVKEIREKMKKNSSMPVDDENELQDEVTEMDDDFLSAEEQDAPLKLGLLDKEDLKNARLMRIMKRHRGL